jgi:hypothetical protein
VDVDLFSQAEAVGPAYLWVGQMVPYKRPDLAIDAFNALGLPLVMIGDGPMAAAMRQRAGPTITILPRLDFMPCAAPMPSVAPWYSGRGGFPDRAGGSDRLGPAGAGLCRGGALDSVTQDVSGQFFASQSVDSLIAGIEAMEALAAAFRSAAAMADARRFAPEHFDRRLQRSHERPAGAWFASQGGGRSASHRTGQLLSLARMPSSSVCCHKPKGAHGHDRHTHRPMQPIAPSRLSHPIAGQIWRQLRPRLPSPGRCRRWRPRGALAGHAPAAQPAGDTDHASGLAAAWGGAGARFFVHGQRPASSAPDACVSARGSTCAEMLRRCGSRWRAARK